MEVSDQGTGPKECSRKDELVEFLNIFIATARDDDYLAIQHGDYSIEETELEGEVFNWILQYLRRGLCPKFVEICLARKILQEFKQELLSSQDEVDKEFCSLQLLEDVVAVVYRFCAKVQKDEQSLSYLALIPEERYEKKLSIFAAQNGRQSMEDRDIVIRDLRDYLPDNLQAAAGYAEYYAVFDGHGGSDAASFLTCHLHQHLVASPNYPANIPLAFKDAFLQTDQNFLRKNSKCGATSVCCLIKDGKIYFAWLGDSEAILVRNGSAISVVAPHKPDRCDERERIESLGGAVIHWGTWRVNGQLAVSRAIGDGEYKPLVSAEPDVTTVEVDGSEDFIILACDGLWDTLSPEEAVQTTFREVEKHPDNLDGIAKKLARIARDNGSDDNISVIVIFLKEGNDLIKKKDNLAQRTASIFQGITSTCSFVLHDLTEEKSFIHELHTSEHKSFANQMDDECNNIIDGCVMDCDEEDDQEMHTIVECHIDNKIPHVLECIPEEHHLQNNTSNTNQNVPSMISYQPLQALESTNKETQINYKHLHLNEPKDVFSTPKAPLITKHSSNHHQSPIKLRKSSRGNRIDYKLFHMNGSKQIKVFK